MKRSFFAPSSPTPGQVELQQGLVHHRQLLGVELIGLTGAHRAVGVEKLLVLRKVGAVFAQQGQAGVVTLAQRLIVHHRVEMAHRRPDSRQAMLQLLEGFDQAAESGCRLALQFADARAVDIEHGTHAVLHMFRADGVEGGQRVVMQQRIRVHFSYYAAHE